MTRTSNAGGEIDDPGVPDVKSEAVKRDVAVITLRFLFLLSICQRAPPKSKRQGRGARQGPSSPKSRIPKGPRFRRELGPSEFLEWRPVLGP